MSCRGNRHGYPVVAESHSDIADYDPLFLIPGKCRKIITRNKMGILGKVTHENVIDAETVADVSVLFYLHGIVRTRIVAEFPYILSFGLNSLGVIPWTDLISEYRDRSVCHSVCSCL